mmetsp:Transcript_166916/g.535812  ORF Transcript_166916/g.535812 Transcript_166916/m.535812 type:complete len:265 (+) Transcript_166916:540-1334(+)
MRLATIQAEAERVEQAAAVARLWDSPGLPDDQPPARLTHLQRVLLPVVRPGILVLFTCLLEVWAAVRRMRPVALVALLGHARRAGAAAAGGSRNRFFPLLGLRLLLLPHVRTVSFLAPLPRSYLQRHLVMRDWLAKHNDHASIPRVGLVRLQALLIHVGAAGAAKIHDEEFTMLVADHSRMPARAAFVSTIGVGLLLFQKEETHIRNVVSTWLACLALQRYHSLRGIRPGLRTPRGRRPRHLFLGRSWENARCCRGRTHNGSQD